MKVAVTGAMGHIGSHLIRDHRFTTMTKEIKLLDNFSTQRYNSWYSLPERPKYTLIEGDVREQLQSCILEDCDVVIHLAANTQSSTSVTQPEIIERNLDLTKHVASCCHMTNTPLIFISSTSVYGSHDGLVNERTRVKPPKLPYAISKLAEEDLLLELAEKGMQVTILRLGTIFGVSPGMQFHTAVSKFCWEASTRSSITVWSTALDQLRPYLHVYDAAGAICRVLALEDDHVPKLLNVVGANATVREILDFIRSSVGPIQVNVEQHPAMATTSFVVDSQLSEEYGIHITKSLEDGIRETLEYLSGLQFAR